MRGSYKSTKGTKRSTTRKTTSTVSTPVPARRMGPVPSVTKKLGATTRRTTSSPSIRPQGKATSSAKSGTVQAGGRSGPTSLTGRALANTRNKGQRGRLMSGRGKPTSSTTPRPKPTVRKGKKRASGTRRGRVAE